MRLLHSLMEKDPEYEHVFFVLCDSHGLQCGLKDILKVLNITRIMANCMLVNKYFKNSPHQYSLLRECQLDRYRKTYGLALAVPTR